MSTRKRLLYAAKVSPGWRDFFDYGTFAVGVFVGLCLASLFAWFLG